MQAEWADLWLPALVAAVVTLAIEYTAKPRLEARKERLLDAQRTRRELLSLVQLAHWNYGMLHDFRPRGLSSVEIRPLLRIERERLRDEIGRQSIEIVRLARLLDRPSDALLAEVLTSVAGTFRAISLMEGAPVVPRQIDEMCGASIQLFEMSRWNPKRRKRQRQVREWHADWRENLGKPQEDEESSDLAPASTSGNSNGKPSRSES